MSSNAKEAEERVDEQRKALIRIASIIAVVPKTPDDWTTTAGTTLWYPPFDRGGLRNKSNSRITLLAWWHQKVGPPVYELLECFPSVQRLDVTTEVREVDIPYI